MTSRNRIESGAAIWGGETTVTLGESPSGLGGRCQELALAAARTLAGAPPGVALLAAGTDGRDGPTDAAGAIVDEPHLGGGLAPPAAIPPATWRRTMPIGRSTRRACCCGRD